MFASQESEVFAPSVINCSVLYHPVYMQNSFCKTIFFGSILTKML
jgi:hypothetical protein